MHPRSNGGAYVISEAVKGKPEAILIATGSEVSLAIAAQKRCEEKGIAVRVASMPCREQFEQMSAEYKSRFFRMISQYV